MTDRAYIQSFLDKNQKGIREAYYGMKKRFIHFISFRCKELDAKYREDVYHEAFVRLQENILKGIITDEKLTTSLLGYLEGIGFREAMKMIHKTNVKYADEDEWEALMKEKSKEYVVPEDDYVDDERNRIIREIVEGIQDPCGRLLTGVFWHEWTIAAIKFHMNYASEQVAKNKKSICLGRVRAIIKENLSKNGY